MLIIYVKGSPSKQASPKKGSGGGKERGGGGKRGYVMGREEEKRISMEKKVEQMSETLAILMEKTSSHESRLAKAEQEIFPPGSNHSEATGKILLHLHWGRIKETKAT